MKALCRDLPGIRARREKRGITIAEAADRVGVSRQCWHNWECGKAVPLASYLPGIAEALGCGLEDLFRDPEAV